MFWSQIAVWLVDLARWLAGVYPHLVDGIRVDPPSIFRRG